MARLMIGDGLFVFLAHHAALALRPHDNAIERILEFEQADGALIAPGGENGRFVNQVFQVRTGKTGR